jgi:formylglycine-generating enzyme required for sulfatase activity
MVNKYKLSMLLILLCSSVSTHILYADSRCIQEKVLIQGGTYFQGANKSPFSDEKPMHEVTINSFNISMYETTNKDFYNWIMNSNLKYRYLKITKKQLDMGKNCFPVSRVNWLLASKYCENKGGRLPTESEWEYAASIDIKNGFTKSEWSSGLTYPSVQKEAPYYSKNNTDNNILYDSLVEVPLSLAGINSINGMMGNLWEWTYDWYDSYSPEKAINPTGPTKGFWKVIRGGSFQNNYQKDLMRTTTRNKLRPESHFANVGFRCVWSSK